jgi:hypothetical protein
MEGSNSWYNRLCRSMRRIWKCCQKQQVEQEVDWLEYYNEGFRQQLLEQQEEIRERGGQRELNILLQHQLY